MIIYQITNTINSNSYVGKTTKSVHIRFREHYYKRKNSTHLHRAINKYGIENFTISVLEETTPNLLNEKERFWINKLQPHYNMTPGGEGGDTSNSENYKRAIKNWHLSRSPKDYATYGMLGKTQSSRFHLAIKKSNCCPVVCDNVEYSSIGEAEKSYPGIKLRHRLDSSKYPTFYRLREKTSHTRK